MAFRNLYISNPAQISVKNKQLIISQDREYSVPVADIASVIIENLSSTITAQALSLLSEHGVAVFTCDSKHLPNGILLPFSGHSRHLTAIQSQIGMPRVFQKRLWQKIVSQKIRNQALVLETFNIKGADTLHSLSCKVQSGDQTSIESIAAAKYFKCLFGNDFARRSPGVINSGLNYSYALVRGLAARSISLHGYIPAIGLCHHNQLNSFNLADDFLEPYRPVVDAWVFQVMENASDLSPEIKKDLYNVFNNHVKLQNGIYTVVSAMEALVSSFNSSLSSGDPTGIDLPSFVFNKYEK